MDYDEGLHWTLSNCITIYSRQPNGKKVSCGLHRVGIDEPSPMDTNEQRLTITEIINHPEYIYPEHENDIALLKVDGTFSCCAGKIWPACLPDKNVGLFRQISHLFS